MMLQGNPSTKPTVKPEKGKFNKYLYADSRQVTTSTFYDNPHNWKQGAIDMLKWPIFFFTETASSDNIITYQVSMSIGNTNLNNCVNIYIYIYIYIQISLSSLSIYIYT